MDLNRAEFVCSIPEIQSAIKIGGDGMRVQFDIPETDKAQGLVLATMTGKRLRVTVEVLTPDFLPEEYPVASKPTKSIEVV